jgi:hypothetical protein
MILHNSKMCWISLSHLKHIFFKYQLFFIDMVFNSPIILMVASILDFLCDAEIMLLIMCFVPMLEIVFDEICCLCNFVTTVKICQDYIHKLYVNPISTFNNLFCSFHGLTTTTHEEMCMKWFIIPSLGIDHLAFVFNS